MKKSKLLLIILFLLLLCTSCALKEKIQKEKYSRNIELKVIAYNVEFGKNTTPKEMADLLSSQKADIICFNEVPAKGWTKRVGKLLNIPYSFEGKSASANHSDDRFKDKTGQYFGKYKSILSKYPLKNTEEIFLEGVGWGTVTAVVADIEIDKNKIVKIFSIHVPSGENDPSRSKANNLAKIISTKFSKFERIVIAGDFNDLQKTAPLQGLYDIGFNDSWEPAKVRISEKTTYPSYNRKGYVIDHIMFRGLKVIGAGIIEEVDKSLSDHSAVWTLFKI